MSEGKVRDQPKTTSGTPIGSIVPVSMAARVVANTSVLKEVVVRTVSRRQKSKTRSQARNGRSNVSRPYESQQLYSKIYKGRSLLK